MSSGAFLVFLVSGDPDALILMIVNMGVAREPGSHAEGFAGD